MQISEQIPRFYEFDAFRVDAVKRLLWRADETVPLSPKVFDTLLALVQHHGRVLDKDELMETIWSDTIVEENNLTQNVSAIRKALGERKGEHRYVVTVPGRGYCFVADVRERQPCDEQNGNGHAPAAVEFTQAHATHAESSRETNNGHGRQVKVPAVEAASFEQPFGRVKRRKALSLALVLGVCLAAAYGLWWVSKAKTSVASSTVRSIAVLPFKPLSTEESEEALGPGMTDALITKLSNIRQIAVSPTSVVMRYLDSAQDPLAMGRQLGVDAVLDGHVQRTGERLRVTVQMIRTSDGAALWAGTFDEQLTDIFAMQDSISEQVAAALQIRLSGEERERLQRRYTRNNEAYRAYLKANRFMNKATKEGLNKGVEYFQLAIRLDPNYALAYAGLADCYIRIHQTGVPAAQSIVLGRLALARALEIDDTVAYVHSMLGFIAFRHDWDFPRAESEYRRARALDPAITHAWFGFYLMVMNRPSEAEAEFKRLNEGLPSSDLALYFHFTRQYDRAAELLRETLELNPDFSTAMSILGLVYEQKGMHKEAIAEFHRATDRFGGKTGAGQLGHAYAVSGRRNEARRMLAVLAERSSRSNIISFYAMALVHAGLGEKDEAIANLEKAYASQALGPAWLRFDPRLDNLRTEPRFQDFVRRTGLSL